MLIRNFVNHNKSKIKNKNRWIGLKAVYTGFSETPENSLEFSVISIYKML